MYSIPYQVFSRMSNSVGINITDNLHHDVYPEVSNSVFCVKCGRLNLFLANFTRSTPAQP
jgi:hypothetical protein